MEWATFQWSRLPSNGVGYLPVGVSYLPVLVECLPMGVGYLPKGVSYLPVLVECLPMGVNCLTFGVHFLPLLTESLTLSLSSYRILELACNDGHPEPQEAAMNTLRLFCRNPGCRQVRYIHFHLHSGDQSKHLFLPSTNQNKLEMVKTQCLLDVAIKMNSSIHSTKC